MNVNVIYTPGITVMMDVTVRGTVNPVGNAVHAAGERKI